jgi:hypothetical protein
MSDPFSSLKYMSLPIASAALASDLTPDDLESAADSMFVLRKHRQLSNAPVYEARREFEKLDANLQEQIKNTFGDSEYISRENSSWFSNAKYAVKDVLTGGLDVLEGFSNLISLAPRKVISGKTWSEAWDGKKLFDEKRLGKVRNFYSKEVFDVAFELSTDKTLGEVVANAKSDAELEVIARLLGGDQEIAEALRDVDTSKISLGREVFYSLFDIDPGEFGANRKAFNFFSGAVDLATQVGLDPLTYIAPWAKAVQGARRGILTYARPEFGAPSGAREGRGLIKYLPGTRNQTFAEKLTQPRVAKAFDEIGENIRIITKSPDESARAAARIDLMEKYSEIAIDTVPELSKALDEIGDFTHQGFIKYIDSWDKLDSIVKGRPGQPQRLLPSYGKVRSFSGAVSGLARGTITNSQANAQFSDAVDAISNGVGAERKIKISGDQRILRLKENALLENTINVRGKSALRDSRKLYALARAANFDRYSAGILVERWNVATEGGRIKMIEGLSKTIGKNLGLDAFDDGQKLVDSVGRVVIDGREAYVSGIKVTDKNFKLLSRFVDETTLSEYIKSGELLRANQIPGLDTDVAKAAFVYQLDGEIGIPVMAKWLQVANGRGAERNLLMRAAGGSVYGKLVQNLTNAWSWAVLVPRLGIRSAIDEIAMFGLTHPATGLGNYFVGRSASKIVRTGKAATSFALTGKKPKGLAKMGSDQGLVYGVIYRNLSQFIDEADIKILSSNPTPEVTERIFHTALVKAKAETYNITRALGDGTNEMVDSYLGALPTRLHLIDDLNTGVARTNYLQDGMPIRSTESSVEILSVTKSDKPIRIRKESGGYEDIELKNLDSIELTKYVDGWQVNLGKVFNSSTDGKVADIVVQNIKNQDKAVKLLTEFWEKNPKLLDEFANVAGSPVSAQQQAETSFLAVLGLISRSDGSINYDLLKAMRGADGTYRAGRLTPETFRGMKAADLPASLVMPQFTLVPRDTSAVIAEVVVDGTYSWMERQVGTLAREPIMYANYAKFWKQLAPNRKAMVDDLMKSGLSKEAAEAQAKTATANLAMNEGFQRTIAFVDNPALRSHLAFTVRNYARFFRSLEDFSRRVYRMAKYEPGAFQKLRLANEGLEHSGFIYEDGEGDKYFMFPGDAIVNNVLNPIISLVTGEDIKTPMPLQFTGKIKMLAPSFDPEAAIPTLSGPMSAVSVKVVEKMFRLGAKYTGEESIANFGDELSGLLVGRYAEGKTLSQMVIPPSVQRALALFSSDDRDSQWASATRKAMMYYAANGMAPTADATPGELEEFKDMVQATARNIVVTRFAVGLLSPVSPTLDSGVDMPDYLRDFGTINYKQAFYDMVNEYQGDPEGYQKALRKWTKVKPGALAYTISETESNTVASVRKTLQSAKYYRDNKFMFDKYPEAAAFFLPFDGDYDLQSYTFLKREGFTEAKPVETFLKEVTVANEKEKYDQEKRYYETLAENAGSTQAAARVNARASAWREQYLNDRPLLKELQTTFSGSEGRRQGVIKELSQMISDASVPNTKLKQTYAELLNAFYRGMNNLGNYPSQTDRQIGYRKILRNSLALELENIARGNPEAEMAVKMLFRPSIFTS